MFFGWLILYEAIEPLQEMSDAYSVVGVRSTIPHAKIWMWQASPVYLLSCEEGRDNDSFQPQFLGNGHFCLSVKCSGRKGQGRWVLVASMAPGDTVEH